MAELTSSISAGKRPSLAVMDRKVYVADGWRQTKVWDGFEATLRNAGIASPPTDPATGWNPGTLASVFSNGVGADGTHLVRYRYMNSKTGYVSEPSAVYTWVMGSTTDAATFPIGTRLGAVLGPVTNLAITSTTITRAAGSWITDGFAVGDFVTLASAEDTLNNDTFGPITALSATVMTIASGGLTANADDDTVTHQRAQTSYIKPSSDSQVDRIVIEMTVAGGATYFKAAEALNSASSVSVNTSDPDLLRNRLPWPDESDLADDALPMHLLPPVAAHLLYYRGRLFAYGQHVHSTGTVDVTNGSATVTGTGTDWTSDALTPSSSGLQRSKRFLRVGTDTRYYEISAQGSATSLTLKDNYAGGTAAGQTYSIFSLDNDVYYSEPGFPESWPVESFVPGPRAGRTRAVVGVMNGLGIYSLASTEYLRYDQDPTDGTRRLVSDSRGAVNSRVVVVAGELAHALDRLGVHRMDGAQVVPLSRPIEATIRRINWTVEEKFHAVYMPSLNAVRWWVALDSDTLPYHYLQLDLDDDSWSVGEREVAVLASAVVPTDDGVRCLIGDENGWSWLEDEGTTDGADATPNGKVTAVTSATVFDVDTTLVADALNGVTAHNERLGETRVVLDCTTSQITLASGFSEAPKVGDKIQFGRVLARVRVRAMAHGGFPNKHQATHAYVWYRPIDEERYFKLRVYHDYAEDPVSEWGDRMRRDDPEEDGDQLRDVLPPEAGGADWRIKANGTGVACVPLGGVEAPFTTEVELVFDESDCQVEVLGIAVEAAPRRTTT